MRRGATPRREFRFALALAFALGMLAPFPARGQRVSFNPALSVWGYYSDDVDVGAERVSDFAYRLQADLPVRAEFERATFELGFTPFLERYDRTGDFDQEGYRGRVSLAMEPTELTAIEVAARSHRLRSLDATRSLDEPEPFLSPRVERRLEAGELRFRRMASARWSWDVGLGYSQRSFAGSGSAGDEGVPVPEGRDELGVELGVYRLLSSRTTLGTRYDRRRFSLDLGGRETLDLMSLFWARRLSRGWNLELLAGVFRREGALSDGSDLTDSGPQGTVTLRRTFRGAELAARAGSVLTSGGELPGTAELRLVELSLGDHEPRPASWRLLARFARRVSSAPGVATVDLATVGGGGEIEFHRLVGLRLEAFYTEQRGDAVLDDAYFGIGAAVVVYPLGRTRLGGAGEGGPEEGE